MKKIFIVANWKSNKNIHETEEWLRDLAKGFSEIKPNIDNKEIIIAPSFTSLGHANYCIKNLKLPIKLAAQNISSFDEGAYTGEINGKQIKEFTELVIIGHSERRRNFGETDEMLFDKFKIAKENGLTVIYCVQGKETKIPANVDIIAYEPINAIGTGNPDSPENANAVASYFKSNFNVSNVLYGGSVTVENVNEFVKMSNIDGVLVGGASLDAKEFYQIIQNA